MAFGSLLSQDNPGNCDPVMRLQRSTAKNKQLKAIYQIGHKDNVTLFGYALKRPSITNLLGARGGTQMLFPFPSGLQCSMWGKKPPAESTRRAEDGIESPLALLLGRTTASRIFQWYW